MATQAVQSRTSTVPARHNAMQIGLVKFVEMGHIALKCYHRFDHSYQAEENYVATMATTQSYGIDTNWYTNTGVTDHITVDLDKLSVREKYHGKDQVQVVDGTCLSIFHIGQTHISTFDRCLKLSNILHIPSINRNLLSVHRLTSENNIYFDFHPNYLFVKDRITKKLLLQGKCEEGIYPLVTSSTVLNKRAFTSVKVTLDLWHCRLGHTSPTILHHVLHTNNLPVARYKDITNVCNAYQQAKRHQLLPIIYLPLLLILSLLMYGALLSPQ